MAIVFCQLSDNHYKWRPDLFPGSDAAIEQGCMCPVIQPWPGALLFDTTCEIHELEKADDHVA